MANHPESILQEEIIPLSLVETGRSVRLAFINGGRELRSRLADMGLVPGMELRVIRNTGGPFIIAVKNSRLALGRGMAQKILVR
ncbi:MAG: ferrous iron transport protein A [Candidatus Omnitrophica bacterium]|nr:ferrous iron transport protein A [Candidatus Omnitrophota bacterium]